MTNLTPHERDQNIKTLKRAIETFSIKMGQELYYFSEGGQYLDLGYISFSAYLADPDVDIRRSTAFALKRVYKTLVLDLKVCPDGLPGWTKLELICPHITEENKTELISSAETLSRSDLKKLMREAFGNSEPKDLFMEGISDILRIVYDIEHLANDGQYKRLFDIKKLLKEM